MVSGNEEIIHKHTRVGDVVLVKGTVGKSQRGDLSLFVHSLKVLSACLRLLNGLEEKPIYFELLTNQNMKEKVQKRSETLKIVKNYFNDFMLIESPMLHVNDQDRYLRSTSFNELIYCTEYFGNVYQIGKYYNEEWIETIMLEFCIKQGYNDCMKFILNLFMKFKELDLKDIKYTKVFDVIKNVQDYSLETDQLLKSQIQKLELELPPPKSLEQMFRVLIDDFKHNYTGFIYNLPTIMFENPSKLNNLESESFEFVYKGKTLLLAYSLDIKDEKITFGQLYFKNLYEIILGLDLVMFPTWKNLSSNLEDEIIKLCDGLMKV